MFVLHLTPDGIRRLDASLNLIIKPHAIQLFTDRSRKLIKKRIALFCSRLKFSLNLRIFIWMLIFEAQIFKFGLYRIKSQAIRKRSINIQSFASYLVLLIDSLRTERTHIMKSVRNLNEDNTYVIAHRKKKFLEILCLSRSTLSKDSARYFCKTVNNLSNLRTKHIF